MPKPTGIPNPEHHAAKLAISTGEAARYCFVTADTIVNWISAGHLRAQRTAGGQFRIRLEDLRSFMVSHGMRTDVMEAEVGHLPSCWEFWSAAGRRMPASAIAATCIDCPVYRSRASVCHEVRPLLPGGTIRAPNCADCDYLAIRPDAL